MLLVEDEVVTRMDAARFLEEEGFNVIESANGEHARTIIEKHPSIHVLFTDVHLPGSRTGVELAEGHDFTPDSVAAGGVASSLGLEAAASHPRGHVGVGLCLIQAITLDDQR